MSYKVDELTKMIEKLDCMSTEEIKEARELCKTDVKLLELYSWLGRYLEFREYTATGGQESGKKKRGSK